MSLEDELREDRSRARVKPEEITFRDDIKWAQKIKMKRLKEGDKNTKFFYMVANGKQRKSAIVKIQTLEGRLVLGETQVEDTFNRFFLYAS